MCEHTVKGADLSCSIRLRGMPYALWCKPCLIDEIECMESALRFYSATSHGAPPLPPDDPFEPDDDDWVEYCAQSRLVDTPAPQGA